MAAIQEDLTPQAMPFSTVDEAVAAVARGEIVIVVDDPGRENEGDFVMAAGRVTPEAVNFMVTHGRGIVCFPITSERAHTLELDPMPRRGDYDGCAFTVSIDLLEPANTGTSAFDRAHCMARAAETDARAEEFRRPGHVFPLVAKSGGVLERRGHTEAAVDLARLAGLEPAGVICEVLKPDGSMARLDDLTEVARDHGLHLITIADLVEYRLQQESLVHEGPAARIPTPFGEFTTTAFHSEVDGLDHVTLTLGDVAGDDLLVRIHAECPTGEVFGSVGCECRRELDEAMRAVAAEGRGAVVYLRAPDVPALECRAGHGSPDTAAQILRAMGARSIRLLNGPATRFALEARGVRVEASAAGNNITVLPTDDAVRVG